MGGLASSINFWLWQVCCKLCRTALINLSLLGSPSHAFPASSSKSRHCCRGPFPLRLMSGSGQKECLSAERRVACVGPGRLSFLQIVARLSPQTRADPGRTWRSNNNRGVERAHYVKILDYSTDRNIKSRAFFMQDRHLAVPSDYTVGVLRTLYGFRNTHKAK